MPLIGTAGHVDHGKSSLIQKLTGRDPDRWTEEKRRGLTIDLGFAWTQLPSGTEVSFVDVPGHERYLKNMLAGIEAIDVALFVVAADEGWMPQSEEHLAVLDLLGVSSGVVALTKSDIVDADLLELAASEVRDRLVGTSLHQAEIVPMSSMSGQGIDDLLQQLDLLVQAAEPPDYQRPRLWIDRVFSASGAGTVVTGSLLTGELALGESVVLYPSGKKARTRGLQSHESVHERVGPGRRVAVNLGGIERDDVQRGDMLGFPGQWITTDRFLATIRTARYVDDFGRRGAFHLHTGSSAQPAEILSLDGQFAIIRTSKPIPLAARDPFILRDTGRRLVTAGGLVLDPMPGPAIQAFASAPNLVRVDTPDEIAAALLAARGAMEAALLAAASGGGKPVGARRIGDLFLNQASLRRLAAEANQLVTKEHETHPLRVGIPIATLAEQLSTSQDVASTIVDEAVGLKRIGPDVAERSYEPSLDAPDQEAWQGARGRLLQGLDVPGESDLGLDPEVIHFLIRSGELIRIAPGLLMLPSQVAEIREILTKLPDEFTVADFRDAAGLSRKYAVPIMEWSDIEGLTVRRGDTRTLR